MDSRLLQSLVDCCLTHAADPKRSGATASCYDPESGVTSGFELIYVGLKAGDLFVTKWIKSARSSALYLIYGVYIRYERLKMRTLVDIPDGQIKELTAICETKKISRAEAIQQAIASFIEKNKPVAADAFGLWNDRKVDGLTYQEQVRSEW